MYSSAAYTKAVRGAAITGCNTGTDTPKPAATRLLVLCSGGGCRFGEACRAAWVSRAVQRCRVFLSEEQRSRQQFGFRMGQAAAGDWSPGLQVGLGMRPTVAHDSP